MADSHPNAQISRVARIAGFDRTTQPQTTTRGFYAVERGSLHRVLEGSRTNTPLAGGGRGDGGLSVTARSLAAFAGVELRACDGAADPPALLERLVCSLDDELWFLGTTPGWVATGLLVPLGADPDDAAALTEGEPLYDLANDGAVVPGLSVLDGARAPAWRAMLRGAARRYEAADPHTLQWLAFIGETEADGRSGGVDRLVYALLAMLTAVIDFADNGQDVLVAAAPPPPKTVL